MFSKDVCVWGAPSTHSGCDLAEHEYCFGDGLLVATGYWGGERARLAYLPTGAWRDFWTGAPYAGDQTVRLAAGLDTIPVLSATNPALRVAGDDLRLWIYGGGVCDLARRSQTG